MKNIFRQLPLLFKTFIRQPVTYFVPTEQHYALTTKSHKLISRILHCKRSSHLYILT